MPGPVCITADDFGLTRGVSEAIVELAAQGAVTAVSVMCHEGADLELVPQLARTGVATGVHLVLCEERPLTGDQARPILDETGRLPPSWHALFARMVAPLAWQAVRLEAEAQVRRYLSLGLPLRFICSHQHVHLFLPILAALRPLLAQHPSARLRGASRVLSLWQHPSGVALEASSSFSLVALGLASRRLLHPFGVALAGHIWTPARVRQALANAHKVRLPDVPELVMHPGANDPETLLRYAHWRYDWAKEFSLLCGAGLKTALDGLGLTPEVPD